MKSVANFFVTILICLVSSSSLQAKDTGGWACLFDGKTLDGWIQKNGTATYRVVDGTIVGKTAEGSPNSFLCSEKEYADFELEFEVRVHDQLNSGVQIRSSTKKPESDAEKFGRVNGPQVEIEASGPDGALSGYIYGEATGRGWLTPEDKLIPHKYFRDGEWNKYRIVCQGDSIRTWINGRAVADLTDDMTKSGFIGLQVHSVSGDPKWQVRWRNLRIREL